MLLILASSNQAFSQSVPESDNLSSKNCASTDFSVSHFIHEISVRILGYQSAGSGVIINHQGGTYTVLTNAHVVEGTPDRQYTVLTDDGQSHTGIWQSDRHSNLYDLALIQFTSDRSYPVVSLASADSLQSDQTVYAAGFPNWRLLSETQLEDTREEGFQAFQLTVGQVERVLPKPLAQGYQLGYTNEVVAGMSGGALLNCQGQLIGVNGVLKHPPQGIAAYTFADGTILSQALFQQIEALSWAIPVSTIRQILTNP